MVITLFYYPDWVEKTVYWAYVSSIIIHNGVSGPLDVHERQEAKLTNQHQRPLDVNNLSNQGTFTPVGAQGGLHP